MSRSLLESLTMVYISRVKNRLGRYLAKKPNMAQLAADAGVSDGWLRRFAKDKIKDPGWSKLEKLGRYLGVLP